MIVTLDNICVGNTYIIDCVTCENIAWAERLEDMGFLPGETVELLMKTYGGDPLAVRVGGSTWALRRAEAACIHVKSAECGDPMQDNICSPSRV
jgi:ferrous iron transport protein A